MDKIQKRFEELSDQVEYVASSFHGSAIGVPFNARSYDGPMGQQAPNQLHGRPAIFRQWCQSVSSLLERVFGPFSGTYLAFANHSTSYLSDQQVFCGLLPIFYSAKSEYEGGYCFDLRKLVHTEVFSDELEQAEHFLKAGYKTPAAVTAGVVLETTLRKLCEASEDVEPTDKLNRMNDDLAREGVYNKMRADQIRAWAKIRNDAAHGNPDEFDEGDVSRMIDGVRDFVANQLS